MSAGELVAKPRRRGCQEEGLAKSAHLARVTSIGSRTAAVGGEWRSRCPWPGSVPLAAGTSIARRGLATESTLGSRRTMGVSEGAGNESAQAAALVALAPDHSFPAYHGKRTHRHPIARALESLWMRLQLLEGSNAIGQGLYYANSPEDRMPEIPTSCRFFWCMRP